MAERASRKSKRPAARRRPDGRDASADSADRLAQRIKALERERDRLKGRLDEALQRIASLEESREHAVNRIDWVIDSLHNVLEDSA